MLSVGMDRIATFKSFIETSPDDPFPRYGLAMEYKNQGRLELAEAEFAALIGKFPDYVAAYLMYGNALEALGRTTDAADAYRRGIGVAADQGDSHTRGELEAALAQLDA